MIRFTSKAAGEVLMLDAHGKRLLAILGKPEAERGVIVPEQIPAALSSLRAAIGEEQRRREAAAEAAAEARAAEAEPFDPPPETVGLAQRAFPLMQMLERAAELDVPVLWGV